LPRYQIAIRHRPFCSAKAIARKERSKIAHWQNLSSLPPQSIDVLRRSLKGENFVSTDAFEIVEDGSPAHGHVDAVMTAMRRLDFSRLICSRRSRQRDLVVAMVTARILQPKSKLATTLWWADTTLPEILDVSDADEDDLYNAMDWLLEHQSCIEIIWRAATLRTMPWRYTT